MGRVAKQRKGTQPVLDDGTHSAVPDYSPHPSYPLSESQASQDVLSDVSVDLSSHRMPTTGLSTSNLKFQCVTDLRA